MENCHFPFYSTPVHICTWMKFKTFLSFKLQLQLEKYSLVFVMACLVPHYCPIELARSIQCIFHRWNLFLFFIFGLFQFYVGKKICQSPNRPPTSLTPPFYYTSIHLFTNYGSIGNLTSLENIPNNLYCHLVSNRSIFIENSFDLFKTEIKLPKYHVTSNS